MCVCVCVCVCVCLFVCVISINFKLSKFNGFKCLNCFNVAKCLNCFSVACCHYDDICTQITMVCIALNLKKQNKKR